MVRKSILSFKDAMIMLRKTRIIISDLERISSSDFFFNVSVRGYRAEVEELYAGVSYYQYLNTSSRFYGFLYDIEIAPTLAYIPEFNKEVKWLQRKADRKLRKG